MLHKAILYDLTNPMSWCYWFGAVTVALITTILDILTMPSKDWNRETHDNHVLDGFMST